MNDTLLKLYHRLPPPVWSLAASLRGRRLRSRRYGPETERIVGEALGREYWGEREWGEWREDKLGRVLRRAATRVPFYREMWAERRRRGDRASWDYLENWPILEKDALRASPESFVADDCDVRRMLHVHTSGTTGKPLSLWRSVEAERYWYALFEARWRRWYGLSRHDRWAILGGQLVVPASRRRPPFWVWNAGLNQLYMSAYHLGANYTPHYLDALARYGICYLWGYTSSLYELALEALRLRRRDLKMRVAIANAEPVFTYQRRAIEEAFQCPVRETYGMAEMVAAAGECEAGSLHSWPDVGWYEVFDGDVKAGVGTGELVATGLMNMDMPLIRYRVGDRVSFTEETRCECGRTLPLMASVEGRTDDVLYTTDGRRVGRLDPVFKENLPIREAQIIQEALDLVRILYVPADGFDAEAGDSIVERVRERMGRVKVVLERVEEVPRGSNGKFRAVVCNLPREVKESFRRPAR